MSESGSFGRAHVSFLPTSSSFPTSGSGPRPVEKFKIGLDDVDFLADFIDAQQSEPFHSVFVLHALMMVPVKISGML